VLGGNKVRRSMGLITAPVFLLAAAAVCAGADDSLASVQWAERLLAHSSFQYQLSRGWGPQWNLRDAEAAFRHILAKYGKDNGRAWAGLARAQAGLGKYADAEDSCKQALLLLPGHTTLERELSQVSDQEAVAQAASTGLLKDETVLRALPYPVRSEHDAQPVQQLSDTLREIRKRIRVLSAEKGDGAVFPSARRRTAPSPFSKSPP